MSASGGIPTQDAAFDHNELIQSWVVRHLEIIGEAASRLSPSERGAHPDVPWRGIIGMRNIIAHSYFDIDLDAVWAVVERDLSPLERAVRESLSAEESGEARPSMRAPDAFHADMLCGADTLKREIGYNPTRFLQMIADHGAVAAVRRLLQSGQSEGFTELWEHGRLQMSVEFFALLPWYENLFADGERAAARRRLQELHFDVDGELARRSADPPEWWVES